MLEHSLCKALDAVHFDVVFPQVYTLQVLVSFQRSRKLFAKVVTEVVSRQIEALDAQL